MYQQHKDEIMKRLKNKMLMDRYNSDKEKYNQRSSFDKFGTALKTGADVAKNINSFRNSLPKESIIPNVGNYGLNTQTFQPQGELASKIGAGTIGGGASQTTEALSKAEGLMQNAGKAVPAVNAATGAISAANNFANGNNVDGALDVAKTGAMFIPGVGWAISGAIQIAQMLKGAKEKADQKAMAKSQEEAMKSQQLSLQNIDDTKQGLEQQRQENLANMQRQTQSVDSNQNLINDLIAQSQNYNVEQGVPTGMASPVEMPTNYSAENAPALPYEGSATQGLDEANNASKVQSIMNGLKSLGGKIGNGINDFNAGYQDNATHGFIEGDLFNQIKTNNEVVPSQTPEGVMTGGANEMQKSIMNRLGELAGTGARVMANPWTQAGIAALATKATGGDGADVLNNAYKYGINKANSNHYAKLMNPDTPISVLQNFTADDYKAKLTKDNHDATMARWKYEQDWKQNKDQRDYDYKVNKDKGDRAYRDKELAVKQEYYKSRRNGDSAERLAWQKEKDRRDKELKLAKQEFDFKNKQLENQTDYGSRDEEYQNWLGKTKTRKIPITQEEAQKQAYEEYMDKVRTIMGYENYNYDDNDPLGVR